METGTEAVVETETATGIETERRETRKTARDDTHGTGAHHDRPKSATQEAGLSVSPLMYVTTNAKGDPSRRLTAPIPCRSYGAPSRSHLSLLKLPLGRHAPRRAEGFADLPPRVIVWLGPTPFLPQNRRSRPLPPGALARGPCAHR